MKTLHSFRWRLLFGGLLLAFGFFTVTPIVTLLVFQRHHVTLHLLHFIAMSAVGTACLIGGVWQVQRGLSPFDQLRDRLNDVKEGRASRLEGRYPSEVEPLANELNAFLAHREKVVSQAIAKAGDLAHGLKTPLAILTREGERVAAAGDTALAFTIMQQVDRMRRQVEYHLAHARAVNSGSPSAARTPLLPSIEGLVRVMERVHAERNLQCAIDVPVDEHVRVEREDLEEMLGNLLDNACKWARSRVAVSAKGGVITIEDDGQGIAPELRNAVLQRGVRADQVASGSGLGLAIVRELAELYGGSIALESSPLGGVCARLTLPH